MRLFLSQDYIVTFSEASSDTDVFERDQYSVAYRLPVG